MTSPRAVLVASWGDYKRARKEGYERIAYLEHGAGQSYSGDRTSVDHPGYSGGRGHIGDGLYLVPNEYSANRWRSAYPHATVEVVGLVKHIPDREPGDGPVVGVSFHWPCGVAPETRTVFTHYRPALAALARKYSIIGHAHPRWSTEPVVRQAFGRVGAPFVEDFDVVCRGADVYVCDNSSTIFEFASAGRPVVVLNGPSYRKDVNHGGRFWDWATVGVQVDRPDDLVAGVAQALSDEPAQRAERERIVDLVYPYREGAAQRAADILTDWAAGQMRRAA